MGQFHTCENCGEEFSENDDNACCVEDGKLLIWYCCQECKEED